MGTDITPKMKLFALLAIGVASIKTVDVTEFCSFDLHDAYKTNPNKIKYVKQEKKEHKNPEKPKKAAMKRIIVRPECVDNARRNFNKPGGYPDKKDAPVIKCTRKGPAGTNKLKPNGRRYGKSRSRSTKKTFAEPFIKIFTY